MWDWLFLIIIIYIVYSLHVIKNQLDAIHKKLEINQEQSPQLTNKEIEKELEKIVENEQKK